jgi:hypothetical protein
MKVIVHTPRIYVEEWDIPSFTGGETDGAILAAVRGQKRGVQARRLSATTHDLERAFVHSRGETDLASVGRRIADARAALDAAMEDAGRVAGAAIATGISERQVASKVGVDRNTVRRWLGKDSAS